MPHSDQIKAVALVYRRVSNAIGFNPMAFIPSEAEYSSLGGRVQSRREYLW